MNTKHTLRGDIQGLRAVAVLLVLLFHVWPEAVPGGYVGVDVFFVISGYLIVGSLAREAEHTGRISLLDFYARRIRRLLPAASLVLIFVFAGMFLWLPQARWEDTLVQIAASALYLENWYLSWAAVDYLASENAASPVQHYWSLSIEEQFYIVWPLIALGAIWTARRIGLAIRPVMGIALSMVFAGSLAASLLLTPTNPEHAYFVTHTRAWELALGGLMAIWLPRIEVVDRIRAVLCFSGLAAIVLSGLTYGEVQFPGYAALLPTVGAALVILAGDFRVSVFHGLNLPPLRYLGDVSYSLYLWHWPLIVFYLASGNQIGFWEGAGLIAATLGLSHLSYHLVEERFRHPSRPIELRPLPAGLASIVMIATAASVPYLLMTRSNLGILPATADINQYPGPAALLEDTPVPANVAPIPAPTQLSRDRAIVYDSGCHQTQHNSEAIACEFGDLDGDVSVAVVGSSHSVNWLPTIDALGRKNGWKVYSISKSACHFRGDVSDSCNEWHDNVVAYLSAQPVQAIIVSEFTGKSTTKAEEELIAKRWQRFADIDVPILAIRPIPHLETNPGDCLPDRIENCVIPRQSAERANPFAMAAELVGGGVHVVDMTDAICARDTCGPIVGNMVVYRDTHHLTATYARALAPYLEQALAKSVPALLPIKDGDFDSRLATPRQDATILCGPAGRSRPYSRDYRIVLVNNQIILRRGDWRNKERNFEEWNGKIDGIVVTISGKYRQGSGRSQNVSLEGTVQNGTVIAAGRRGPRVCSIIWPLPDERVDEFLD